MDNVLIDLIRSNSWVMRVLGAVRDEATADAWVGAGVVRDRVWGERYGEGLWPERVRDVDVAFFNPHDLSRANDDHATEQLARQLADVPWEAKNQAAVHFPVKGFCSRFQADLSSEHAGGVGVRVLVQRRGTPNVLRSRDAKRSGRRDVGRAR